MHPLESGRLWPTNHYEGEPQAARPNTDRESMDQAPPGGWSGIDDRGTRTIRIRMIRLRESLVRLLGRGEPADRSQEGGLWLRNRRQRLI
jgi:hypothetical protein